MHFACYYASSILFCNSLLVKSLSVQPRDALKIREQEKSLSHAQLFIFMNVSDVKHFFMIKHRKLHHRCGKAETLIEINLIKRS